MRLKRTKTDLTGMLSECECNYARLRKLAPTLDQVDECLVGLGPAGLNERQHSTGLLRIEVLERFKYTLTVRLSEGDALGGWLKKPSLTVRLYHDAEMAEVIHYENMRQLKGRYDYPNPKLYQRDEKGQLNLYLGQWLSHCLKHGYSVDKFSIAGAS